jgi:hypothetical protein
MKPHSKGREFSQCLSRKVEKAERKAQGKGARQAAKRDAGKGWD